jgi:DNA-binding protein H-NS
MRKEMTTLEKIQARMQKLQAQAEALIAKQAQGALDQIRELMIKHGFTTEDIEARAKAKRGRAGNMVSNTAKAKAPRKTQAKNQVKTKSAAVKSALPPKYRDPKSGATWSGKARPPLWIRDVKDRSKFLIDHAAAEISAVANKVKPAVKKAGGKKVAAKKAPAQGATTARKATTATKATKATKAPKATKAKAVAGEVTARKIAKKPAASGKAASAPAVRKIRAATPVKHTSARKASAGKKEAGTEGTVSKKSAAASAPQRSADPIGTAATAA